MKEYEQAIVYADKAAEVSLGDTSEDKARILKVRALLELKRYQSAIKVLNKVIKQNHLYEYRDNFQTACSYLAWIYSTCRDEAIRNPVEALKYARKIRDSNKKIIYSEALAAAHAVNGDWAAAVKNQEQAISVALSLKLAQGSMSEIQQRLQYYQEKRIWLE